MKVLSTVVPLCSELFGSSWGIAVFIAVRQATREEGTVLATELKMVEKNVRDTSHGMNILDHNPGMISE